MTFTAQADDLFSDDFEEGGHNRWHVDGDGTIKIEPFDDGHALRLTKRGYAMAAVRIDGQFDVRIEVSLAGENLEAGDACVAESSADGGAVWMDVVRVDNTIENKEWRRGEESLMLPGPMSTLVIRIRAEGTSNSDICWADDVRVIVDAAMAP